MGWNQKAFREHVCFWGEVLGGLLGLPEELCLLALPWRGALGGIPEAGSSGCILKPWANACPPPSQQAPGSGVPSPA